MTERRRISSGGPWEASTGYSRAIVDGDSCWVAGTTDAGPDGTSAHPGDAARQAAAAWEIVRRALEAGGFSLEDVVRTRMYVVSAEDVTAVSAVHGSVFGGVRPAATLVQVAGLIDPSLLIEVEADARRRARGRLRWSGEPDRAAAGRDGDGDDQAEQQIPAPDDERDA